jgi:hypothetical protein
MQDPSEYTPNPRSDDDEREEMEIVDFDKPTIVSLYVKDKKVCAEFPPDSDPEFQRELRILMESRFKIRGGRFKDHSSEAEVRFFDRCCRRIWPIKINGQVVTNTVPGWQKQVPLRLKLSFAKYFQETMVENEEDIRRD